MGDEHEADLLPAGLTAGHWTDTAGRTGCTVVLARRGGVAGVDVRGAAPGTFGTDALRPGMLVERAHAVLLTGGSAFGLAAADGIMRYLDEHGVGYPMGPVRVPIVAGAVIFDLLTGDPRARPDAGAGYAACQAATRRPAAGLVGAGAGATVAKAGGGPPGPGGLGAVAETVDGMTVAAIMVANSAGGIWDDERHEWVVPLAPGRPAPPVPGTNTTIGVVVTDARLTKEQANRVATVAHDGIARAVRPAHTRYDGDTVFCLATGTAVTPERAEDTIEAVAAQVVARAIAGGVRAGQS